MEIGKIESRDLYLIPALIASVTLIAVGFGHFITTRSDRPTNVQVSPAATAVDVHVPQQNPVFNVTQPPATVTVKVPETPSPTFNVTIDKDGKTNTEKAITKPLDTTTPKPSGQAKLPVLQPQIPQAIPAVSVTPIQVPTVQIPTAQNIEDLYSHAEKYIESYCTKKGLESKAAAEVWNKLWDKKEKTAIDGDPTGTMDEQRYINEWVVNHTKCFDINSPAEDIVEGCRVLIRYRDKQLSILKGLRDAATPEHLNRTVIFLSAGYK